MGLPMALLVMAVVISLAFALVVWDEKRVAKISAETNAKQQKVDNGK